MQPAQNVEPAHAASVPLHPLVVGGVAPRQGTEADRDRQFVAMLRSFRETGGLARGDEVAELLAHRGTGDVSRLARWIVSRDVIGFDWRGELWVPLFQFELGGMTLRTGVAQVTQELAPEFDPWALAVWFSTPNAWLSDRSPAEAVGDDVVAVTEAARADRFALAG